MISNLVIVESPAKAKTIEKFLGKEYKVVSSYGHIRDLAKKDNGINIDNNYELNYIVSSDKKKIVAELKKLAKEAEQIWLASDEDREGEAIAWHLMEVLKLDKKKTKRIVFHEITKQAITNAIENSREIDYNLVDAQKARRVLDRLVGFEMSPVLWKKVKHGLSAGRVQSVAVRLVVEKEEEIKNFKPENVFKVSGNFLSGKKEFKADLNDTFNERVHALDFLKNIAEDTFIVADTTKKPGKKSPPPPFTTSTLQQEANRKLGYSVAKTMMLAQKLYENGFITYMRTDSVNLSDMALGSTKQEIIRLYGEKYSRPRKYKTKTKGAQEAHEAIRPTYINNKTIAAGKDETRLYGLIWKRTIASQMSEALLERTQVKIEMKKSDKYFVANGEIITFDGFLKAYTESSDDDNHNNIEKGLLPPIKVGEELNYKSIQANEKYSTPIARYSEASLVRKLEDLGIGRPSTYAPTIATILNRGYVVKEDRQGKERLIDQMILENGKINEKKVKEVYGAEKAKLFPTDVGIIVNEFLTKYFKTILDYNFTATIEEDFDKIAAGDKQWVKMVDDFYKPFHKNIEETVKTSEKSKGERLLGQDPETGKNVYVKIGRYGPMAQIGEQSDTEKPRFASLLKNQSIQTITLEEALNLFKLPRIVGKWEGEDIIAAIGRFGPYVKYKGKFYSLGKLNPLSVNLNEAIELIKEIQQKEKKKIIKEFKKENIQVLKGRYGPYISQNKKNYRLSKKIDPETLTFDECLKIIEKETKKKKK